LKKLNEDFARYDVDNAGILAHDQVKKLMTEVIDGIDISMNLLIAELLPHGGRG